MVTSPVFMVFGIFTCSCCLIFIRGLGKGSQRTSIPLEVSSRNQIGPHSVTLATRYSFLKQHSGVSSNVRSSTDACSGCLFRVLVHCLCLLFGLVFLGVEQSILDEVLIILFRPVLLERSPSPLLVCRSFSAITAGPL